MNSAASYIFECSDISKSFGGVKALRNVQLRIGKGEVHALLGENGAGKSTLMKIIIGLYKADSGSMKFDGETYKVNNTADALSKGISMIHQELNPVPHLTIAESIFLNREDVFGNTRILDKRKTNQRAKRLLEKFDMKFRPDAEIHTLSLAQIQMIEIVKAVSLDAKMIIMDEPTSSLDFDETNRLFRTIRELKEQGVSIIYISHRMDEIFSICDRVSVFRDGAYISTHDIGSITKDDLISLMVGKKVESIFPKEECAIGGTALEVKNLCGDGFEQINFAINTGEIVGLSGLVGSGRSETALALFGLSHIRSGEVYLDGKLVQIKNAKDAIDRGICMVNEDRKRFGLCLHRSIRENTSLPSLHMTQPRILIDQRKEIRNTKNISVKLSLKAKSIESEAYSLSGGNQQKVVIAKWLLTNPKVLILDEPTRGVDVGAKADIHRIMGDLAKQGVAILMISSELPEILGMSDRIYIYHEGRINGVVQREQILSGEITEEDVLSMEFGRKIGEKSP